MIKRGVGRQFVSIDVDSKFSHERSMWSFCQNGYQSTGVNITVQQFDILRELMDEPAIVKYYDELRKKPLKT